LLISKFQRIGSVNINAVRFIYSIEVCDYVIHYIDTLSVT